MIYRSKIQKVRGEARDQLDFPRLHSIGEWIAQMIIFDPFSVLKLFSHRVMQKYFIHPQGDAGAT